MRRLFHQSLVLCLLAHSSGTALAIQDTANNNTMSDVWERHFNNGSEFQASNPNHAASADPDQDGWSNFDESVAGTDPFSAAVPDGLVRPVIVQNPAAAGCFVITWPSIVGKNYRVRFSTELITWGDYGELMPGSGQEIVFITDCEYEEGGVPESLFFRVKIEDEDPDGDTLTTWEELQLGTFPDRPDSDYDGFRDDVDPLPHQSATEADPDGLGMSASIMANIVGWWDFQQNGTGSLPLMFPSRVSPNHQLGASFGQRIGGCMAGDGLRNLGATIPTRAELNVFGTWPNLRDTQAWSVNYWIKVNEGSLETPAVLTLVAYGNIGGNNPNLEWRAIRTPDNQGTRFLLHSFAPGSSTLPTNLIAPGAWESPKKLDDGYWHHLSLTIGSGPIKMYFDGVAIGTPTSSNIQIPSNANTTGAWLYLGGTKRLPNGGTSAVPQSELKGRIDSVMTHRRTLSAAEILSIQRRDRDQDGLWDITEVSSGRWRDDNSNALVDSNEIDFVSHPNRWQLPGKDSDDDGLTDAEEQVVGTNCGKVDTDGDLLPDKWELDNGLDPTTDNRSAPDQNGNQTYPDSDGDGLDELDEYRNQTNPNLTDSDTDGVSDFNEVNVTLSDPNDSTDKDPVPPEERFSVKLGVGDRSGSESEDYVLDCFEIDGETGEEMLKYVLRSGGAGGYSEKTRDSFRKGRTYTFQIKWQNSKDSIRTASGGTSAEGPDFDYHLVIEPQGDHGTTLFDAYDPRSPTTGMKADPILDPQDVNPTDDDDDNVVSFTTTLQQQRVALVSLRLEWEALAELNNVGLHVDPWENQVKGNRIFPGRRNPNDIEFRARARLHVSGGLAGMPVTVASYDIDDSTSEVFDVDSSSPTTPIIDTNGTAGGDNFADVYQTPKDGQFWDDATASWGVSVRTKNFSPIGQTDFDFRVGMQPGNNYRVAASVHGFSGLASVQVTNASGLGYLGPEIDDDGDGMASPPLTVWRKLWVENDSMEAIPADSFGYKRNDISWNLEPARILSVSLVSSGSETAFGIPWIDDQENFLDLDNGMIIAGGNSHSVSDTASFSVTIPGNYSSISVDSEFRLYDDDDFGLLTSPLPRIDLVGDLMKGLFKIGFIEIVDAALYNPNKIVPFKIHDNFTSPTSINSKRDLFGSPSLWICPLTAAYQTEFDEDGDPFPETPTDGQTGTFTAGDHSAVYVENCREWYDQSLRVVEQTGNLAVRNEILERYENYIIAQASHEMGHQPGTQHVDIDHSEGGLMRAGGAPSGSPEDDSFFPASILRFRKTETWSES